MKYQAIVDKELLNNLFNITKFFPKAHITNTQNFPFFCVAEIEISNGDEFDFAAIELYGKRFGVAITAKN